MGLISAIAGKKGLLFVGGILAGLVLPPIVRSKTVRKAAVAVTAKSMNLKDNAVSAFESIKEEAQDIYAEAKYKECQGDGPEATENDAEE